MKLTPKTKIYLGIGILGVLLGALWALVARGPQITKPILPALTRPSAKQKEEERLPPPSKEKVGRLDPFLSLEPKPPPSDPQLEAEGEDRGDYIIPAPTSPAPGAPAPQPAPRPQTPKKESPQPPAKTTGLPWKLVGLGAGAEKMALVQKDGRVLILKEGDRLDGWTLVEIRAREVVFSRNGERVSIAMEEVLKIDEEY